MRRGFVDKRSGQTLSCLFLLALVLGWSARAQAQDTSVEQELRQGTELRLRESTLRILGDHRLKHMAERDPAEAIRALDRVRADGDEPADEIAIAIAEVAIRGGHRETGEHGAGLLGGAKPNRVVSSPAHFDPCPNHRARTPPGE